MIRLFCGMCVFSKKSILFLYDSSSRNGGRVRSGAMRRVSDFSVNDKCITVRCDARSSVTYSRRVVDGVVIRRRGTRSVLIRRIRCRVFYVCFFDFYRGKIRFFGGFLYIF